MSLSALYTLEDDGCIQGKRWERRNEDPPSSELPGRRLTISKIVLFFILIMWGKLEPHWVKPP
jgi:hypothetical protein